MKKRPITPLTREKAGVPPGGTTGALLLKNSNKNFDTRWSSDGGGGKYRQFTYNTSAGDFQFIKISTTGQPVMTLLPLE